MHRIHQHQSFIDTTLSQTLFNLGRNVKERPARGYVEPQFLTIALHQTPRVTAGGGQGRGGPPVRSRVAYASTRRISPRAFRARTPGDHSRGLALPCASGPTHATTCHTT